MRSPLCRSCGQPIRFVATEKGSTMPLDLEPDEVKGNISVVKRVGYIIPADALPQARSDGSPLYVSHFATCPEADKHRKSQPRKPRDELAERRLRRAQAQNSGLGG